MLQSQMFKILTWALLSNEVRNHCLHFKCMTSICILNSEQPISVSMKVFWSFPLLRYSTEVLLPQPPLLKASLDYFHLTACDNLLYFVFQSFWQNLFYVFLLLCLKSCLRSICKGENAKTLLKLIHKQKIDI